jgi:hypothetical protein
MHSLRVYGDSPAMDGVGDAYDDFAVEDHNEGFAIMIP